LIDVLNFAGPKLHQPDRLHFANDYRKITCDARRIDRSQQHTRRRMSELDRYDYELPAGLVAQHPAPNRTDARLVLVDRRDRSIAHHHVRDLPELLQPGDCLVLNETRVLPARLAGRRAQTGGRWEGLFLGTDAAGQWRLLCKTRGRLGTNEPVILQDCQGRDDIRLWLLEKLPGGVWLARPDGSDDTATLLTRVGRIPLPHYIHRPAPEALDSHRYQTVYARVPGSAAAPTAGLHFSEGLLARLEQQQVELVRLTLHVGLDTFRPIAADSLADHRMHSEWGEIGAAAVERIAACRRGGGRCVAVGTTSGRVLETAAPGGE
jgi:S-adenosylmethionine:tRNA ribosyltransferase-isomerase